MGLFFMVSHWIVPTDPDGWELVKTNNVYAFAHKVDRDKIKPGDKIVFYLIRSDPPVFVGVYEIARSWEEAKEPFWTQEKAEGKVIWPWRFQLAPLRLGAVDARKLSKQLSYIEKKDAWPAYFVSALANFKRPIPEDDYKLIFEKLAEPPIAYQVKPLVKRRPLVAKVERREVKEVAPSPSHPELIEMLRKIGEILGFVTRREEPTPDGVYRCDVTWRDYEGHRPIKVFEVEVSGNVDHALSSLTHAYDKWGAEELYLIVSDESDLNRARKLVEPRIRGTFVKIFGRLKVLTWPGLKEVYDNLKPHENFVRDLSKRS